MITPFEDVTEGESICYTSVLRRGFFCWNCI